MTPHAQNLALAKIDGWQMCQESITSKCCPRFERKGVIVSRHDLPRYTESLDALRPILLEMHEDRRYRVVVALSGGPNILWGRILSASAAQLSEAILRALGKYT